MSPSPAPADAAAVETRRKTANAIAKAHALSGEKSTTLSPREIGGASTRRRPRPSEGVSRKRSESPNSASAEEAGSHSPPKKRRLSPSPEGDTIYVVTSGPTQLASDLESSSDLESDAEPHTQGPSAHHDELDGSPSEVKPATTPVRDKPSTVPEEKALVSPPNGQGFGCTATEIAIEAARSPDGTALHTTPPTEANGNKTIVGPEVTGKPPSPSPGEGEATSPEPASHGAQPEEPPANDSAQATSSGSLKPNPDDGLEATEVREQTPKPEPAPTQPRRLAKSKSAVSSRKGKSKWDDPNEMLTNPKAPLATAELRDILCSAEAWDVLTAEEKRQVLDQFPDGTDDLVITDGSGVHERPDVAALRNSDNFRRDVARYQADLAAGKHEPEWIRQAQAAHSKRAAGLYDEYLAGVFRDKWGMDMPGAALDD